MSDSSDDDPSDAPSRVQVQRKLEAQEREVNNMRSENTRLSQKVESTHSELTQKLQVAQNEARLVCLSLHQPSTTRFLSPLPPILCRQEA